MMRSSLVCAALIISWVLPTVRGPEVAAADSKSADLTADQVLSQGRRILQNGQET